MDLSMSSYQDDGVWIGRQTAENDSKPSQVPEQADCIPVVELGNEESNSRLDCQDNGISRTEAKAIEMDSKEASEPNFFPCYESAQPEVVVTAEARTQSAALSLKAMDKPFVQRPFYASHVRQRDILDDGEPPRPRAGWPVRHLTLYCLIEELDHLPRDAGSYRVPYFFVEVRLGNHVYKTQVCQGDTSRIGYVRFNQLIKAQVDDEILEAVSKLGNGVSGNLDGPCLTVTCFDCGRRFKNNIVGQVIFSMANLLELKSEGWHEIFCNFVDLDGMEVLGDDRSPATLSMAIHIDERCKIKWKPPTLAETLRVCEGPLTLQAPGRRKKGSVAHVLRSLSREKGGSQETTANLSLDSSVHGSIAPSRISEDLLRSGINIDDLDDEDSPNSSIVYWKEELEQWLDGIVVQLVIISLVILDVTILIVFTMILQSGDSEASLDNSTGQNEMSSAIVTIVILACFLFELSLRQLVKGMRFWMDRWCVFDFVVIWLSVSMAVVKYILAATQGSSNGQLQTANSSTNALRIMSRVAVGLRVLRILINLRHARKLSGKVQVKLRGIVSQNRRRFTKHGFDLDATYITSRIIAMSAPSFGTHSAYRNDIHVVSRFLAYMHYGSFFVFNLCDIYYSSDKLIGQYHPSMLFHQVQRIPTEDHCPPLLVEVVRFCEDATRWMLLDQKNVVAAHCKGGKGRTGVFISALLVWSGHRRTALDALELFTFRRSDPYDPELGVDGSLSHGITVKRCNQTVEGPSQIRYVHYAEAVLYSCINPFWNPRMTLLDVGFRVGPTLRKRPWHLSFTVSCSRAPLLDSRNVTTSLICLGSSCQSGDFIVLPLNAVVWGDVRLDFFKHADSSRQSKRKLAFFLVFHTAFYTGEVSLEFGKKKLDILCKDSKNKKTDSDFEVDLRVSYDPSSHALLSQEETFKKLVMRQGTKMTFTAGQTILKANENKGSVLLIVSGAVEGVVDEAAGYGPHNVHPLGKCVAAAWSSSVSQTAGTSNHTQIHAVNNAGVSGGCKSSERVPNICVLGPGAVIEAGLLGIGAENMEFRARSTVELYSLSRHQNITKGSRLWHSLQEHLGLGSLPDYAIAGLSVTELPNFFRGYAISLATQLSRIQAEVIRIGGLRAFSDRQTVMIEVDEDENIRKSCIRQFSLPINERLLLKARCFQQENGGKGQKIRLVMLANHVVFDPAFFGPTISANAQLFPCHQLCSVTPPHAAREADGQESSTVESSLKQGSEKKCLDIIFLSDSPLGTSLSNSASYDCPKTERTVMLDDVSLTRQVYAVLSGLCQLGERVRDREAEPFLKVLAGSDFGRDAEKVAVSHPLNVGQKLDAASNVESLFQVRFGEIKLRIRSTGEVFQVIRRGQVFGLLGLTLQAMPGHYYAEASVAGTEVLELRRDLLDSWLEGSPRAFSRLYRAVCRELAKDSITYLKDAFPGTWSQHHVHDDTGITRPQRPTADIRRSITYCSTCTGPSPRSSMQIGRMHSSSEEPSPRFEKRIVEEPKLPSELLPGRLGCPVDDSLPWLTYGTQVLPRRGSGCELSDAESPDRRESSSVDGGMVDPILFSRRTTATPGITDRNVEDGLDCPRNNDDARCDWETQAQDSKSVFESEGAGVGLRDSSLPSLSRINGRPSGIRNTNGELPAGGCESTCDVNGGETTYLSNVLRSADPDANLNDGLLCERRLVTQASMRRVLDVLDDGRLCAGQDRLPSSSAPFAQVNGVQVELNGSAVHANLVQQAAAAEVPRPPESGPEGLVWLVDDVWT